MNEAAGAPAHAGGETPAQRAQRIRRMFSAISPRYDFLNHALSLNIDRWWRRAAVLASVRPAPKRVLDVCAGTGDFGFAYARRMERNGRVAALDFSRPMLRLLRRKALARGLDGMFDCIEGDAARMPVPGASFDLACIGFGLRNVVEWRQALSEMARAVRPGGLVVVLEFSTPPRGPIRRLYLSYFLRLLPRIGNRLSRSQAYRYLPESVMAWPEPQALSSAMEQAGLMSVVCRRLTFGIACLHIGRRGA